MPDLYKPDFGQSNVASASWNGHQSLILTNLVIDYLNTASPTIAPKNIARKLATSSSYVYAKNLLHDGSKWYTPDYTTAFYLDIEADSISSTGDFAVNNCVIIKWAAGKWRLICDNSGTREVNRAKVFKTLFDVGQSGGARATSTYITNLSALKSPDTIDTSDPKRVYYVTWGSVTANGADTTGTFAATTNNADCQLWGYCQASNFGDCNPAGNGVTITMGGTQQTRACSTGTVSTVDELQADTSGERVSNPSTVVFAANSWSSGDQANSRCFFTTSEAVNFVDTNATGTVTDFSTTHSVPDFTAVTEDETTVLLETDSMATITSSITTACAYASVTTNEVSLPSWTTKFSFDGGSNFGDDAQEAIQKEANVGTDLRLKVEFTRSGNDTEDFINAMGVIYG